MAQPFSGNAGTLLMIVLTLASLGAAPHHGLLAVESTVDETVNFAALHTYRWEQGNSSFYVDPDALIVAAVDAEMSRRGFSQAGDDADVAISYFTVAATYMNLKWTPKRLSPYDEAATHTRSTLVVVMRQGTSSRRIWTAVTREFLDPDPAQLGETIRRVAARLFETYPHERSAER